MEPGATGQAWAIEIPFPKRDPAPAVLAGPRRPLAAMLEALGLTGPRPIVLVIGGAKTLDPTVVTRLKQLMELGVVRAAGQARATIVDGGTKSGVMAVLGAAAAESDVVVELVGVAPAGQVKWDGDSRPDRGTNELEPNHTRFLLANSGEWGGETPLLFDVVDALRLGRSAVAVIAGGGDVTVDEARQAARRGIPIVAIQGTGGTADELATRVTTNGRRAPTGDTLAVVLEETDVIPVSIDSDSADLERLIGRLLGTDQTLAEAWRERNLVAKAARRQQREFHSGMSWLLILGLLLTFLVVSKASLDAVGLATVYPGWESALGFVILLLPITTTILATATGKFRPASRWILLRGTSETMKREIFRYRTRSGIYSPSQTHRVPREVKLAEAIGSAKGSLMRTDVNALSLRAWPRPGLWPAKLRLPRRRSRPPADPSRPVDDPLSPLTAAGYITFRIDDQIDFYDTRIAQLEKDGRWVRWLIWIYGGLGTLLAAIGFQIWVAVTTAVIGVFASIIEAWQIETSVTLYNQASTDLTAIRAWWNALPPSEQGKQANIDRLVDRSERIMRAEHAGWVQEMQDAMTQLRLEQAIDQQGTGKARGDGAKADDGKKTDDNDTQADDDDAA